ncbi:MAG: TetR/AcrR family transcriptional regulator [Mycobacteriaceae bacterium]
MAETRAASVIAAIRKAALEVVDEAGYDRTTVGMICERAEVSRRTFFNHFARKDDVFLDHGEPCVDQRAAHRFLISDGPLVSDVMSVISMPDTGQDGQRMRLIASTPALLSAHVARMATVEDELRELTLLRLQHQRPRATGDEVEQDATMVACLVAGIARWSALNAGAGRPSDVATARDCLNRVFTSVTPPGAADDV